jgi:hypothetical protein
LTAATPDVLSSGFGTSPTAAGLQNNLNDLLNIPYASGFHSGPSMPGISQEGSSGDNTMDEMFSMQLPIDAGMEDAWKTFAQDQGFQDTGLF